MGISHEQSSPYNPRSNGQAEATVKIVKALLEKSTSEADFRVKLLEWKNVPRMDGFSPAQMFFGRRQRTTLPADPNAFRPIDVRRGEAARKEARISSKRHADKGMVKLQCLREGDRVLIQHPISKLWDSSGKVIEIRQHGRSYYIETDEGTVCVRNRRFLKPIDNA